MMPETVAALAAGHRINVAGLFEFEFASSTQRYWDGLRWQTFGAYEYLGAGQLIGVSGLGQARGLQANPVTFTLSGVDDDLIAIAADSAAEVTNRRCAVYLHFLTEAGMPLDSRVAIWVGRMDVMTFSIGVERQAITLSAESLFIKRKRAPHGYQTDADQQVRFPGDKGFEFMAMLRNKTVKWLRE